MKKKLIIITQIVCGFNRILVYALPMRLQKKKKKANVKSGIIVNIIIGKLLSNASSTMVSHSPNYNPVYLAGFLISVQHCDCLHITSFHYKEMLYKCDIVNLL